MSKFIVRRSVSMSMVVDANSVEEAEAKAESLTPSYQDGKKGLVDDMAVWEMDDDLLEAEESELCEPPPPEPKLHRIHVAVDVWATNLIDAYGTVKTFMDTLYERRTISIPPGTPHLDGWESTDVVEILSNAGLKPEEK